MHHSLTHKQLEVVRALGPPPPTLDAHQPLHQSLKPTYALEVSRRRLILAELVGEGNFGQVWRASLTPQSGYITGGTTVAVKTVKLSADERDSIELLKEIDIMVRLCGGVGAGGHKNVVQLVACCTEAGECGREELLFKKMSYYQTARKK